MRRGSPSLCFCACLCKAAGFVSSTGTLPGCMRTCAVLRWALAYKQSLALPLRRPPDAIGEIVGLKTKKCVPCEAGTQPLAEPEVNKMRLQVGRAGGGGVRGLQGRCQGTGG